MKYYTTALINNKKAARSWKAIFFGHSSVSVYYQARHRTENIFLLWIEASQFGKIYCYPCVLEEHDGPLAFQGGKSSREKKSNADLVTRWNLLVNPATFETDFNYEIMDKRIFNSQFRKYQDAAFYGLADTDDGDDDEEQAADGQPLLESGDGGDGEEQAADELPLLEPVDDGDGEDEDNNIPASDEPQHEDKTSELPG